MNKTYLSGIETAEGRRALAEVLLAIFRHWGLQPPQQARLLGMDEVASLWDGAPLPNSTAVLERAGLLLGIDRQLAKRFPEQQLMHERWVSFPNIWLQGRSPLEKMLEGVEGIREVRTLIEQIDPQPEPPASH